MQHNIQIKSETCMALT